MHDIRRLTQKDAAEAGSVLGRAFGDSPVYNVLLAHLDGERRAAALTRVKRGFVEASVRYHAAKGLWVGDGLAGVSLVLAPGEYPVSLRAELWQSSGCATTGIKGILHFVRMRSYLAKKHVHEKHFYLFVLGVDPPYQRRGLGKEMLRGLHEQADALNLPCYLETDKATNVRLYESVGYRVLTDEEVPGIPRCRLWTMRRPPGGANLTAEG
jgi:ribosomal protein S18 acetylase RimI-like enzyme